MPPKEYKPRANTLSRADLAKLPNDDSGDDEDVRDFSDERDERFDADDESSDSYIDDEDDDLYSDDENGDLYSDESEGGKPEQESTQAHSSATGSLTRGARRLRAPVKETQIQADARLAESLGKRSSGRNRGEKLPALHWIGLDWSGKQALEAPETKVSTGPRSSTWFCIV
jgi:hypothetical protein